MFSKIYSTFKNMWYLLARTARNIRHSKEGFTRIATEEEDSDEEQTILIMVPKDFTDLVGGLGWWQFKIFFITTLYNIPSGMHHLGMGFLAYPVDHWCQRPKDENISIESWWSEALPNVTIKGKLHHSQCEMYVKNSSDDGLIVTRKEPCSQWEYSTEFNSIVSHWDLVCTNEWMISTGQSIYMAGFLIAVLVSGQLSDIYGRKPTIFINIAILLVAGIAAAFAPSFLIFTILRFFIALGHAGMNLVSYVLFLETVGAPYRAMYASLNGFGWHVGYMIFPLFAYLLKDWFYLQLLISLICLLYIPTYWFLPESPRWLLSKGKIPEAVAILEKAAELNGKETKNIEEDAKTLSQQIIKENEASSNATVLDLLKTPNLRKKTLCLYFTWVTIAFTYYGLSLNTNDLQGDNYVNFFLSGLMEIPGTVLCVLILDRFGRKASFIFTLMIGGVGCLGCIFIPQNFIGVKNALAMSGKLFVSASFTIVYLYSAELFPTVARNAGVGSCSTLARIGSIIAPFMKELAKVTNESVPLAIFGILSIISGLLVLLLPETNKHPIPETLEEAENFGKKDTNIDAEIQLKSVIQTKEKSQQDSPSDS